MEAVTIHQRADAFTQSDAAVMWALTFNTLDCSHLSNVLASDLRYVSEWAEDEINNRDDYLEHLEARLQTIRNSTISARAELAEMPPFPGSEADPKPCVMVDLRGKPLATVLFEVDGDNIIKIEFCLNPAPDACVRKGIFPGQDIFKIPLGSHRN